MLKLCSLIEHVHLCVGVHVHVYEHEHVHLCVGVHVHVHEHEHVHLCVGVRIAIDVTYT